MSILVVGSVAYDDLETPAGRQTNVLGGTATNFSMAANFFTKVHIVGVVGDDFEPAHMDLLQSRGVDVSGIKVVPDGKTFRWAGHYMKDLNSAVTLDTKLGVFATFDPELSENHRQRPFLFLAAIHPKLQLKVLNQMERPRFVALDTMNLWINTEREALEEVIRRVDLMFVNEGESKLLTGESNVAKAAKIIQSWGPKTVVIKRGEYGALLFTGGNVFAAPAIPLSRVVDPTGAGDTFAGGFLGCVARENNLDESTFRRAAICGSVMASFQVEDFGPNRLSRLTAAEIDERFSTIGDLASFDMAPIF